MMLQIPPAVHWNHGRSSVLSAVSTAADVVLVTSSTPEPWTIHARPMESWGKTAQRTGMKNVDGKTAWNVAGNMEKTRSENHKTGWQII